MAQNKQLSKTLNFKTAEIVGSQGVQSDALLNDQMPRLIRCDSLPSGTPDRSMIEHKSGLDKTPDRSMIERKSVLDKRTTYIT